VRPNAGLLPEAVEAGSQGILVTHSMETAVEGVYAAGDVVRGPVCGFDRCEIHALWTTAVEQGHIAGLNLAGQHVLYDGSLSMNVTEMFGLTVASLGEVEDGVGDQIVLRQDEDGLRYFRLVRRGAVPLGAVALGGPEAAAVLGRLRPFVRNRRPLADTDTRALLEGRELSRRLAPGAAAAHRRAS
jgi:nitrite reductase (NADH) large subunit